ncbi:hypothetical protein Tco_0898155, partial [Tanacetum coccineum]
MANLKTPPRQDKIWKGWAFEVDYGSAKTKTGSARSLMLRILSHQRTKKVCQFIKGVKLPDGFGSNFKHKVTDNDTNITGLKSHDCHIMMQCLLPYGLQQYLPPDIANLLIELYNNPGVSESSELFALACEPSQTPISVNSCIVNSVRFVMHSRDERRTTQNSGIYSPGLDGEIYYGQLEQILEFSYLSLNDLEIAALHIDGQSIDVDAPPDIIDVVDEDDDIIDEKDPIPHDLADSDDEDLVNLDIDCDTRDLS